MTAEDTQETVLGHILNTVPSAMFEYIAKHQRSVYEEVRESVVDPRYSPVEGRYLAGYLRRGLVESLFRKAAEHAGLKWADVVHPHGRFSCVHIFAGNLQITTHHVHRPGDFVRPCASRHQNAVVNKFLDGYYLRGALLAPLPTLQSADAIQLYLLHGQKTIDAESMFLNLVMPDSQLRKYQWQRTIPELQQAYFERSRMEMDAKQHATEPKPKIKPRKERVAV